MNNMRRFFRLAFIAIVSLCVSSAAAQNARHLPFSNADLKPATDRADREAKAALAVQVLSIVTKQSVPPSGDKHDYMSQAPYFWADPKTANGFPYIRRDGERNPEIKRYPDHDLLDKMIDTVERLAFGYHVTGREEYATRAVEIIRMWFLDPGTKMNPNLEFAQAIPGVNTGRGIGIIETRGLPRVIEAIGLLKGSASLSKTDRAGVRAWFANYLSWMTGSKNGSEEREAKNNHGTFYDVQIVSFALFAGKRDLAKRALQAAKLKRIAHQIMPDGSQPLELERTKSWDYSTMNLDGLVSLAELGDRAGVDLWSFNTRDGRSIRRAIEFLQPFAAGRKEWPFKQITLLRPDRLHAAMRKAGRIYRDPAFQQLMASVPKSAADDRAWLSGRR